MTKSTLTTIIHCAGVFFVCVVTIFCTLAFGFALFSYLSQDYSAIEKLMVTICLIFSLGVVHLAASGNL